MSRVTVEDPDLGAKVYTRPDAVRFVLDARRQGLDPFHYRGRGFAVGPAVVVPPGTQVATDAPTCTDSMGLDVVVYTACNDDGEGAPGPDVHPDSTEELAGRIRALCEDRGYLTDHSEALIDDLVRSIVPEEELTL